MRTSAAGQPRILLLPRPPLSSPSPPPAMAWGGGKSASHCWWLTVNPATTARPETGASATWSLRQTRQRGSGGWVYAPQSAQRAMRSTPSLPAAQNSALASVGWGSVRRTGGRTGAGASGTGEVEDFTGIQLDDPVRLVIGYVGQRNGDSLAAVGPVAVRVGVVDLDADAVDADLVPVLDAELVLDVAAPEVLLEQVARPGVEVDRLKVAGPGPDLVHPFPDVGEPADAALRQHELEPRVLLQLAGEDEVGRGPHQVGGVDGEGGGGRRVVVHDAGIGAAAGDRFELAAPVVRREHLGRGRESGDEAAGAEVQADHDAGVLEDVPERSPVVAVERGQAERHRAVGERDHPGALGGDPLQLGHAGLDVPDRQQRQRHVAAGGGPRPLVDTEVVPGLQARER